MTNPRTLGPWLRRFPEEHLVTELILARNTQLSYRDTLALLLPFVAGLARKPVDRLAVRDVSAECVLAFLRHVEEVRGCSARTGNQRLGAIRAFARYVASRVPAQVEWCDQIRAIPLKKAVPRPITYLEKPEFDVLLESPSPCTARGCRERALLWFVYSTGGTSVGGRPTDGRGLATHLRRRGALARHATGEGWQNAPLPVAARPGGCAGGMCRGPRRSRARVPEPPREANHTLRDSPDGPALREKSRRAGAVAGHQTGRPARDRHTTATHLLRSGVDINTIRALLGHARIDATNIYAEIDIETEA